MAQVRVLQGLGLIGFIGRLIGFIGPIGFYRV